MVDFKSTWRPATKAIHCARQPTCFGETSQTISLTSGFRYETAQFAEELFTGDRQGFVYSRYANPTVDVFEQRMAALEGAQMARATASGMAAVTASLLCQLSAGDHVVAPKALFGSCLYVIESLLPRFGIDYTLVDGVDYDQWQGAVRVNTKVFFLETPTNPMLDVIDIARVAAIAGDVKGCVIVDNVFASPVWQKPLEYGANVVVYSTTKHIDGQGRCLGGMILSDNQFYEDFLGDFLRHTGPSLSPFNAWVMLKGLETLPLRMEKMSESAGIIADAIADSPAIEQLRYPGRTDHPHWQVIKKQMKSGSNLIAIVLRGDKDAAFRFINALRLFTISNNLGDAKSLITHPASTTHQRLSLEQKTELGITDTVVRLSIGLEDVNDLLEDIYQALKAI